MKFNSKRLALSLVAGSLLSLPLSNAFASADNGVLIIINKTSQTINVSCPNKLKTEDIKPNSTFTEPYGSTATQLISVHAALNLQDSGDCSFSVAGNIMGSAHIQLSDVHKSNLGPLFDTFGKASISVNLVTSNYKVSPPSVSGANKAVFAISPN